MKHPVNQNSRYRSFIQARDLALEDILQDSRTKTSDVLRGTFEQVVLMAAGIYSFVQLSQLRSVQTRARVLALDERIEQLFEKASFDIVAIQKKARRHAYLLAYIGEAEAVSRATGKAMDWTIPPGKLKTLGDSTDMDGHDLLMRIDMFFDELRRKLVQSFQKSLLLELPVDEMTAKLLKVLPKRQPAEKRRKSLYKPVMKEAADKKKSDFGVGFISDDDWEVMLDAYLQEYVPTNRGPEHVIDQKGSKPTKDDYYAWEQEQYLTQDYVNQVRAGQVDVAKANGITDFVWIAVVDQRTDECCLWRDGLLTSEIEKQLKGPRKDDECQVAVPPAHFSCRCTIAPATEAMPDYEPAEGAASFEEWLNN